MIPRCNLMMMISGKNALKVILIKCIVDCVERHISSILISKIYLENQSYFCQVNLLTTVLNDAPVQPEDDDDNTALALKDSPQCVTFGLFMIW